MKAAASAAPIPTPEGVGTGERGQTLSGDRMKSLAAENEVMRQQLKDYPQNHLELTYYKPEYERQRNELREAYMNLNK